MKYLLPVLASGLLLASCSEQPAEAEKKAEISISDYDQNVALDDDFILPQPITLIEAFSAAGLQYIPGKTNPTENKDKYAIKADQLFNLGVYSTDLAYCVMNNKTQEASKYLAAVQSLGAKAGLESVFSDKQMISRFEKNLDNKEALTDLIYEIQEKLDVYLEDNDLRHLASIQFAGAWTEGLYLACDQWKQKAAADPKVNVAVADQMNLLENILEGIKNTPAKDKRITEIARDLDNLFKTYSDFESVKKANTNPNYETPKLTSEEFNAISAQISAVRGRIISGK